MSEYIVRITERSVIERQYLFVHEVSTIDQAMQIAIADYKEKGYLVYQKDIETNYRSIDDAQALDSMPIDLAMDSLSGIHNLIHRQEEILEMLRNRLVLAEEIIEKNDAKRLLKAT